MRSKDGGAALGARGSPDGCTEGKSASYVPASRDIGEQLITRDAVDDFMTAIDSINTRGSGAKKDAHARGVTDLDYIPSPTHHDRPGVFTPGDPLVELSGRDSTVTGDLPTPTDHGHPNVHYPGEPIYELSGRDASSEREIQARSFWGDAFGIGLAALTQILRRDVTPELLAARDSAEDLVSSIMGSHDSNSE